MRAAWSASPCELRNPANPCPAVPNATQYSGGRLVTLELFRCRVRERPTPHVEARRPRCHHQRLPWPDGGRGLVNRALEPADLAARARDPQGNVMAPELVPKAPRGDLLVDRLTGEDRPHGLGAQVRRAAHHPLALGPELLYESIGHLVDVGEHERRALILAGGELARVRDALLQRLRPALPQPRVAKPV